MGKKLPISEAYDYTPQELEELHSQRVYNMNRMAAMYEEGIKIKARLQELRTRWKELKFENQRIDRVMSEFRYRMQNIRR